MDSPDLSREAWLVCLASSEGDQQSANKADLAPMDDDDDEEIALG
jgi:hypothetical protein